MGSCRGIATSANACSLASLRALCLVVGSLPSRALVQMSLRGNTSPPPNEVDELFATCLRASRLLTSADVIKCHTERSREYLRGSAPIKPFSNYVIARSDCPCRAVAIPRKGYLLMPFYNLHYYFFAAFLPLTCEGVDGCEGRQQLADMRRRILPSAVLVIDSPVVAPPARCT